MRKYITVILAIVVLGGAFALAKGLGNRKKPAMKPNGKSIPLAFVHEVKNTNMPVIIPASGSLIAKNKIMLFSEVQGVFESSAHQFRPGVAFNKGEVLFKLNSDEVYTNLLAQKSAFQNLVVSMMPDLRLDFAESYPQWESYLNAFDIDKSLVALPEPKSDKEKRFVAAKNIFANYYNIKNLEIKLAKYTIYAPFSGVLTEANVNMGSLVSPGQSIGEFIDPSVYEMEVSVSSAMVSKIKVGDIIEVENLENNNEHYTGKIIRINNKVDRSSQTVNVFIELSGNDLKEGMYLKAYLKSKVFENIVEIPRNLLVNQHQIYIVKDSVLHLKEIQLIHQNENTLIVSGLNDNEVILIKPMPKAFEGMKVTTYKE